MTIGNVEIFTRCLERKPCTGSCHGHAGVIIGSDHNHSYEHKA